MNKLYIVGAGPGDPELLTIKGKKHIDTADIIIYAGSLVNPIVIESRKKTSKVYNSAHMTLEEVLDIIEDGVFKGFKVVRVHTGEPSIYGAIREQIDNLKLRGIETEIIPGISCFQAAAARLKKEFTLPDVSQSLIITRLEGRTPVPEKEKFVNLAKHQTSMAIFLSVHRIEDVVEELLKAYPEETKSAVIQRVTWENEIVVEGTLKDIAKKVKEAQITKTALILVGNFLGDKYSYSKLYDKTFTHEFRKGQEDETSLHMRE